MWHHVAATPVHRFNERAILLVFRHRQGAMAGTLVLQTARSLDRGAICMTARLSLHLHADECFAQIGTGSACKPNTVAIAGDPIRPTVH